MQIAQPKTRQLALQAAIRSGCRRSEKIIREVIRSGQAHMETIKSYQKSKKTG